MRSKEACTLTQDSLGNNNQHWGSFACSVLPTVVVGGTVVAVTVVPDSSPLEPWELRTRRLVDDHSIEPGIVAVAVPCPTSTIRHRRKV